MSNAPTITIDRSEYPLVVVRFRGAPTTPEFARYLEDLAALYREAKPFALIVDSSHAEAPPATHRKMQADWIKQHERVIRTYNMGTAFITPSVVLRGALTAILWLQPLPCPHHVCADEIEAKRWARSRLAAGSSRATI
jgi:hypothetical protein